MSSGISKIRHRLRRRIRRIKPWVAFSLAILIALIAVWVWQDHAGKVLVSLKENAPVRNGATATSPGYTPVDMGTDEPADAASEVAGQWYGLCEKGRVRSVEDFRMIVANDPLLARHFAGFDWKNARMGKNEEVLWTYLSYRKGGTIFSTTKKIKLPLGDGYISDGQRKIRTFCCNDYIEEIPAVEEVAAGAPLEDASSAPMQISSGARRLIITQLRDYFPPMPVPDRSEPPTELTMLTSSTETIEITSSRRPRWLWYPGETPNPVRPPSIDTFRMSVPEPSSLLLTSAGIAFLGFYRRFRRRKP